MQEPTEETRPATSGDAGQAYGGDAGRVVRVGLAQLTLSGDEQPFRFTRSGPDEYFTLTIAGTDDPNDVSVYRMGGTIAVTVGRDGTVSVDRVDLTGEVLAGRDRGELRLTSESALVADLRRGEDRDDADDEVSYTGEFATEGTLLFADRFNNAETLGGRDGAELSGMRLTGRIVDAERMLVNVTGTAALLGRAGGDLAPAAVTM